MDIPIETVIQGGALGTNVLLIYIIYYLIKVGKQSQEKVFTEIREAVSEIMKTVNNHIGHNTEALTNLANQINNIFLFFKRNGNNINKEESK